MPGSETPARRASGFGRWLRRLQAGSLWKRWKPLCRNREIDIRPMRRVYASVRRGNIPALRAFARAGFRVLTGRIRDNDGCQGEDFVTVLRELD